MSAVSGEILWEQAISTDVSTQVAIGTRHVFVMESAVSEASGLKDGYVSRRLMALDITTGVAAWTVDLEDWVPEVDRGDAEAELRVVESGGGTIGLSPQVGVEVTGWSGLNADTGSELWHSADLTTMVDESLGDPMYVGDGVVLSLGDGADPVWTAQDVSTKAKLWTAHVPRVTLGEDITLEGSTLWQQGDKGALAVDVQTGNVLLSRRFPLEWLGVVANRDLAVAVSGQSLEMVKVKDLRTPLWSVPAGSVEPLAVSADTVVVAAQSGVQLLNAHTGELIQSAPVDDTSRDSWKPVVDGLVELSDGSIFMLSPPRERV